MLQGGKMSKSIKFNKYGIFNLVMIFTLMLGMLNISNGIVHADEEVAKKPVIAQGETVQVSMNVNSSPQAFALTLGIENFEEGDTFTWSISSVASHGTASVGLDGKETAITYLPEKDYAGEDEFTVKVVNQLNEVDEILVQVSVAIEPSTPTLTPEPITTETTETPEVTETPTETITSTATETPTATEVTEMLKLMKSLNDPNFTGYITLDFIAQQLRAYGWPASTEITLSIDNPSDGPGENYSATAIVSNDSYLMADFTWPTITIEPGATLTVSDNGNSVQLINNLAVQKVDTFHNTISGSGAAGASLVVSVNDGSRNDRNLAIGGDGTWVADFHIEGDYPYGYYNPNLSFVRSGWAQSIESNGNQITVALSAAPPFVQASPYGNYLSSYMWPANAAISLTITGSGANYTEQGSANAQGSIDFNLTGFTLASGHQVTVTDGTTTKTIVVANQSINLINYTTDLLCGTANSGSEVLSVTYKGRNPNFWYTTADQQGNWCFDFSSSSDGVDIAPGFFVRIEQSDEDGDFTVIGKTTRNPKMDVLVSENEIYTYDWEIGASVKLTIDDPSNGDGDDYEVTKTVIQGAHNSTDLRFYISNFELAPGQLVTLTDGANTKTILLDAITITNINLATNTIFGTAPPNSTIDVIVSDNLSGRVFSVSVGSSGTWQLFTMPSGSLVKIALVPGLEITCSITDIDGDRAKYSQTIPQPGFEANLTTNTISGWDWPLGSNVTITIDDPATSETSDFSATTAIIGHDYDPHFNLDLGTFKLAAGQTVTVSDGTISKSHVVRGLAITNVDIDTDVVSGTSDTTDVVDSWICGSKGCIYKRTDSVNNGAWTSDFAHAGDQIWEIDTFNILNGTQIFSKQTDEDGDATLISKTVAINQPPVADAGADITANKGATVTFDGSASTDPEGKALTYAWDMDNDGSFDDATGSKPAVLFTVVGTYPIALQVTDDGGLTSTDSLTLTIQDTGTGNQPPVAAAGDDFTANEGQTVTLDGSASTDPEGKPLAYAWDLDNDGLFDEVTGVDPNVVFVDEGVYTITLQVTDEGGLTSTDSLIATIQKASTNLPPVAAAGPDFTVYVGETVELDGSASTDPEGKPLTYAWDLDNNGVFDNSSVMDPAIVFNEDGIYTIGLQVTDDGGLTSTDSLIATVLKAPDNLPPVADAGADITADEGSSITFNGSASSDPEGKPLTYAWDLDNDGVFDDATVINPAITYADNGVFQIGLRVTDNLGLASTDKMTVTILNVAPEIKVITVPQGPQKVKNQISASAAFTDRGNLDTFTGVWDWSDGTTSIGTISGKTITGNHRYQKPGIYIIKLTLTDKDGGEGKRSAQELTVFDTSGGQVSGNGWISSPAGSSLSNQQLNGKLNFVFNAAYRWNLLSPFGKTSLVFKGQRFTFVSNSYSWLVINGNTAFLKGSGRVNGKGNYSFLISVQDGVGSNKANDLIRIKIWNKTTGVTIYDTQPGADNSTLPTTAINGGTIKIGK
jgi:PKD repeat protein